MATLTKPSLDPIPNETIAVHSVTHCFINIQFNIICPFVSNDHYLRGFPAKTLGHIFLMHAKCPEVPFFLD